MEFIEGGDVLRFAQRQQGCCVDEFTLRPIVWDLAAAIYDAKRLGSAVILVGIQCLLVSSHRLTKLCCSAGFEA